MKKLLSIFVLSLLAIVCAAGFIACDDGGGNTPDTPHTHEYTDTVVEPTCTEQGYTLHKCACGDEYKDNYTNKIAHSYANGKCTVCGDVEPTADEYFTFTLLNDGTYGITAKNKNNMPAEVVLPSTYNNKAVTSIGGNAFSSCKGLTSIIIPDSVTIISAYAFYGCSNLTSIIIPDSVIGTGEYAFPEFSDYSSLQYNEYDNGYYLGNSNNPYVVLVKAKSTDITSCIINDKTKCIYYNAFYYCERLTDITIPDSVTFIGDKAFYNCSSLSEIMISDSVEYMFPWSFRGCPCIKIDNGLSYVDKWVVDADYDITTAAIKDGSVGLAIGVFSHCVDLKTVIIPDSVKNIVPNVFYRCDNLTNITVDEKNTNYKSIDGNLYSKDGTVLIQYAIGKTTTEFIIPDSVTSIGDWAFYYCSSLTSVTIPDSVTSIGYDAFEECRSLTSIIIPDSVTSIGDRAFNLCSSLTSITFGGTQAQWQAVSKGSSRKSGVPTSCVVHCTDGDVAI